MRPVSLLLCLAAGALVAGCSPNPKQFETVPVLVPTAQGAVTCQLYTPLIVMWDRAIDWPRSMNVEEADGICRAEGIAQRGLG